MRERGRGAVPRRLPPALARRRPRALRTRRRSATLIVVELRPNERAVARGVVHALRELPGWEVVLLRTRPLIGRPAIPRDLARRVHVRTARDGARGRSCSTPRRSSFPGVDGLRRVTLEAPAAGCAIAHPHGVEHQPELAAAATARLAEDDAFRAREGRRRSRRGRAARLRRASHASSSRSTTSLPHAARDAHSSADPLADRPWIVADLHMHTSWSHDCSIDAAELVDHAEAEGLGAIAVTDHNVFGGALEAVDHARGRDLDRDSRRGGQDRQPGRGDRPLPRARDPARHELRGHGRGDPRAGRARLLPHPFDRMHAIPDPRTLHRHLTDIDVLEVYNARLLFEGYNDEALRFARKYNLTMGAGSDAHVLQGVGTGALRMRAFRDPEEFMISLVRAQSCSSCSLILQPPKWSRC